MAEIMGLTGIRPSGDSIRGITCPPYDVIKPGTELEKTLQQREDSLYHITLGPAPVAALSRLLAQKALIWDEEPCFYVYEQEYSAGIRTGVLTATRVTPYEKGDIIRHEKTFDEKVKGRLELRKKTGYTFEPVFLLTKSAIGPLLEKIKGDCPPVYEFVSDFAGVSELHGIKNRIFRVPQDSADGRQLQELVASEPLYIADGHHRFHASLLNGQTHCLAYICPAGEARIQAYNRVINGLVKFREAKNYLDLEKMAGFTTPPKHAFALYSPEGSFLVKARQIPTDVVGRLDCSILEKEFYPHLGLSHSMITDPRHFDYYAEGDLDKMKECVDQGRYDLAIALHPVSIEELLAVADAGIKNPQIVMPEKSTFFAPKILSGIFIYRHVMEQ